MAETACRPIVQKRSTFFDPSMQHAWHCVRLTVLVPQCLLHVFLSLSRLLHRRTDSALWVGTEALTLSRMKSRKNYWSNASGHLSRDPNGGLPTATADRMHLWSAMPPEWRRKRRSLSTCIDPLSRAISSLIAGFKRLYKTQLRSLRSSTHSSKLFSLYKRRSLPTWKRQTLFLNEHLAIFSEKSKPGYGLFKILYLRLCQMCGLEQESSKR